jgi:tetratricopeptide (TPR) repeat protein/TolB-like protein
MSSLFPGYNYDIFISYRQKDNKYDSWVTEFVDNLKKELEATFKEEVSVYFDINLHDGLLETHDVDASLKEKLKCLVFIPIILRTYCDPKSFAWEHEFKAFVEQASQDKFGLKVKLPNGNVANRVLPVRIHDLDIADIKECESVLGSVLRGVEFIYKEPGINRSLSPKDHEEKNLNNTNYRNQINKVALAIKEIILGMKAEPTMAVKESTQHRKLLEEVEKEERKEEQEKPAKLSKGKLLIGSIALAVLLIIAAILAYPKIFKKNTLDKLRSSSERISVAVMPFQNMTNDTTWNVWQDGIQNLLITSLSNTEEFKVRQTESINGLLQSKGLTNYASITPSVASSISQQLEANVVICGSINKAGSTIRVITKLIDSKTQEAFKAFQIECPSSEEMIFHIIDSLSLMVNNYLIISKLRKQAPQGVELLVNTSSPEAYRYYVYGTKAFFKRDYLTAVNWFSQSVAIDSNFNLAITNLSFAYAYLGELNQAAKLCLIAYKKIDQMPMIQKMYLNWAHAMYFETPYEEIKYLKQFEEFDDQSPVPYYFLGNAYYNLYQFRKAIPEFEKALEIYSKWGSKPMWIYSYILPATACHITGQYKKEKNIYKKAEHDFPGEPLIIIRQAILSFTEKDTTSANRYIEEYISVCRNNSEKEASIMNNVAGTYSEAGILDKADEYYRKALSLEPDNPFQLNNLAWFLIDKDRNINEGMELIDKALKLSPNDFNYIDTKGWGLYKQGRFQEALKLLEISWNLRPIYSHEIYLHLEAARKAVAGMK